MAFPVTLYEVTFWLFTTSVGDVNDALFASSRSYPVAPVEAAQLTVKLPSESVAGTVIDVGGEGGGPVM